MRETEYQGQLINRIQERLPGSYILKNDPKQRQGIPDLLVLFGNRWAALEVKTSAKAPNQPNQEFYIQDMGEQSFAAFIYPEIEEDVLDEMESALRTRRAARVPQRQ